MEGLLQATFDGVETAFSIASEWVRLGTYLHRYGNPSYDAESDTIADQTKKFEKVRVIQVSASLQEREASPVAISDAKFIIPSVDLPGIEPTENDVLSLDDVAWNVLVDKFVPGRPIFIVFGRRA